MPKKYTMDWTALLRLPSTILLILAVIALLFTLFSWWPCASAWTTGNGWRHWVAPCC